MLTSLLSPEQLGGALSTAVLGALLDVAGFLCFVVIVWVVISDSAAPPASPASTAAAPELETAMKPLEADLSRYETLPVISTAASPLDRLDELLPDAPASGSAASGGGGLAIGMRDEMRDGMGDGSWTVDQWPPEPRQPGAKAYRYVFASGQLVRLRDLRAASAEAPSRAMLS